MDEHVRVHAKRMMRKRFRGLRQAMPAPALAARSHALAERLLALTEMKQAQVVALFWPIARYREVDLREVDAALRAEGRSIAYPSITEGVMTFRIVGHTRALEERGLGFAEPPPEAAVPERIDVVLVPGIAFDAAGHRLGYGAGYYDRTLPRFRPPAVAIGVAFDFQLAAEIPHDDSDVAVDMVVTDRRVLVSPCSAGSDAGDRCR